MLGDLHEVESVWVFFIGQVASVGPIAEFLFAVGAVDFCLAFDAWADADINVVFGSFGYPG